MKKFAGKILLFLAVCLSLWLANSYTRNELADRAVVLGLAIDKDQSGFEVTAEVVAPSGQDQSGGADTKLLSGKGKTIEEAVGDIHRVSGKDPSLAQTGIILMGEGIKEVNVLSFLGYFTFSDAFKDDVVVAFCEGNAKDVFESASPVEQIVSFALQDIIKTASDKTGGVNNYLQKFAENQISPSSASYLSVVKKKEQSASQDEKGEGKKPSLYDCSSVCVFNKGQYAGELDETQSKGFALLSNPSVYASFVVTSASNEFGVESEITVGIASKKISFETLFEEGVPVFKVEFEAKLKRQRTDASGDVVDFLPESDGEISEDAVSQISAETQKLILAALNGCKERNCDYMNIADLFFKKFGNLWTQYAKNNPDYLNKVVFEQKIKVSD